MHCDATLCYIEDRKSHFEGIKHVALPIPEKPHPPIMTIVGNKLHGRFDDPQPCDPKLLNMFSNCSKPWALEPQDLAGPVFDQEMQGMSIPTIYFTSYSDGPCRLTRLIENKF
jgi:hypothetical protein